MRHTIQGANDAPRKRCPAPSHMDYAQQRLSLHFVPATYSHTAVSLSSPQHIIEWLPTPCYTYGTVRIHLTPLVCVHQLYFTDPLPRFAQVQGALPSYDYGPVFGEPQGDQLPCWTSYGGMGMLIQFSICERRLPRVPERTHRWGATLRFCPLVPRSWLHFLHLL